MIRQIFLPLILVAAFIVAVGLFIRNGSTINLSGAKPSPSQVTLKSLKIGKNTAFVEVANTDESRAKGLSGRPQLETNRGMLFVFTSRNSIPTFWMKDMLFPLDMIWIKDGKIIKIDKSVPAPAQGTLNSELPTYSAGQPVDYVLEVNAGFSDANQVEVGDSVDLSDVI